MKYQVTRFKSLAVALKEVEPLIRSARLLHTGGPSKVLSGTRPPEAWANWLLCVAITFSTTPDRLTFSSDPLDGDGIIHGAKTGETWQTEHVMVPLPRSGRVEDMEGLIPNAIEKKGRQRSCPWQDPGGVPRSRRRPMVSEQSRPLPAVTVAF